MKVLNKKFCHKTLIFVIWKSNQVGVSISYLFENRRWTHIGLILIQKCFGVIILKTSNTFSWTLIFLKRNRNDKLCNLIDNFSKIKKALLFNKKELLVFYKFKLYECLQNKLMFYFELNSIFFQGWKVESKMSDMLFNIFLLSCGDVRFAELW